MRTIVTSAAVALMAGQVFSAETPTPLSKMAASLELGMQGCDVVEKLGQPTWIFLVEDLGDGADAPGSEWKWENAQCFPVIVKFDRETGLVSGWDEGRSFCLESAEAMERFLPTDEFRMSEARNTGCIR